MQHVDPVFKDLYELLEERFHPLNLCKEVERRIFTHLRNVSELAHYEKPLQTVVLMRLLKQLSQVFETMQMAKICELVPFATAFEIEKVILQGAKDGLLQVRLNHRDQSVHFGTSILVEQSDKEHTGPKLQALRSEMMRNQLTTLSKRLNTAYDLIHPGLRVDKKVQLQKAIILNHDKHASAEHARVLSRKTKIEKRKEYIEAFLKITENERALLIKAGIDRDLQNQALAEKQREEERMRAHAKATQQLMDKEAHMQRVKEVGERPFGDVFIKICTPEELMDPVLFVKKQVEFFDKIKIEKEKKLRAVEKKLDFLERAKRTVEIPLLLEKMQDAKAAWVAEGAAAHAKNLKRKEELQRLKPATDAFVAEEMKRRQADYDAAMEEYRHRRIARDEQERVARQQREAERTRAEAAERQRSAEEAERQLRREADMKQRQAAEEAAEEQRRTDRAEQDRLDRARREKEEEAMRARAPPATGGGKYISPAQKAAMTTAGGAGDQPWAARREGGDTGTGSSRPGLNLTFGGGARSGEERQGGGGGGGAGRWDEGPRRDGPSGGYAPPGAGGRPPLNVRPRTEASAAPPEEAQRERPRLNLAPRTGADAGPRPQGGASQSFRDQLANRK